MLRGAARALLRSRSLAISAGATCIATSSLQSWSPSPEMPHAGSSRWPVAARCDGAAHDDSNAYPTPPAKLDDPEENANVLASWRAHLQEARQLFAKLDVDGAERALQLALEEAAHFGNSSGPVATSLLNLAQLYRRAGRFTEAEPLLVRAADVLDQTAGPNNKVTLLALLDLAATQLDLGKAGDAIEVYKDALARLDTAEANQSHGRAALRDVRANCLFHMAKASSAISEVGGAETLLREALRLVEEMYGPSSSKLLAPCAELARVLSAQGRREEGAEYLARAMELPELRQSQKIELEKLAKELGGKR